MRPYAELICYNYADYHFTHHGNTMNCIGIVRTIRSEKRNYLPSENGKFLLISILDMLLIYNIDDFNSKIHILTRC